MIDSLTLLRALGRLTMNQREAYIDTHVLGRTQVEIAATMGVSRSRVWQLVQDAQAKLERDATLQRTEGTA